MCELIIIFKVSKCYVRINLCCFQRRVAEQFADGIEVGAAVEHICCKRMAQNVGRHAAGMDPVEAAVNDIIYRFPIERLPVGAGEELALRAGA